MQMVVVLIVLPCDRALMLSCVPRSLALSAQRVLCVCLNTRPIFSVKTPTSALKGAVIGTTLASSWHGMCSGKH